MSTVSEIGSIFNLPREKTEKRARSFASQRDFAVLTAIEVFTSLKPLSMNGLCCAVLETKQNLLEIKIFTLKQLPDLE